MNIEKEREAFEAWWDKEGQYCRAGGGDYEKTFAYRAYQEGRRAALQEQPSIPEGIHLMAERIAADKFEHCTADPIFTVHRKRVITGIDPDYGGNIGWFDDDGNLIESEEAEELEARYEETGDEPEGCTRTGYFEEWGHQVTFITMEAAQEFAKAKGENYRVYVDSGCRNHEWKALRAFLLSLAPARRRIEGEGNGKD